MHTITKRQSEHQNEWDLYIKDSFIGSVEVVFLTNTSRTCVGSVAVMTTDGQCLEYSYDGETTRKITSIAQFIAAAQEAFGDHELQLMDEEEEKEEREFDNLVLIRDVTDENAERLAAHMGIEVAGVTPADKAGNLRDYLRAEKEKMALIPMYDLVRRSKFKSMMVTAEKF